MSKLLLFALAYFAAAAVTHADPFGPWEATEFDRVVAVRGDHGPSNRDVYFYVRGQTILFVDSGGKTIGHPEGYSLEQIRAASLQLLNTNTQGLRRNRILGAGKGLVLGLVGGATAGFLIDFFGSLSQGMAMASDTFLDVTEPSATLEALGGLVACVGANFGYTEPARNLACLKQIDQALHQDQKETTLWVQGEEPKQRILNLIKELNHTTCAKEMAPL